MLFLSMILACGNKEQTTEDSATSETEDTALDTGEDLDPQPPESFSISLSGAETETLLFDTPTCQIPDAAPNLNVYWRNGAGTHKFVLRMMLRNSFEGAGEYDNQNHDLTITLQEEAGGQARFYQTDTAQGDSASMSLQVFEEIIGEPVTYGTATVTTMHNGADSITLNPSEIPVWCDKDNTN